MTALYLSPGTTKTVLYTPMISTPTVHSRTYELAGIQS